MLADVKKYAERHDIKGLRYIFVDCLDVDPTFEKYKADYEYCKTIEGMFEEYQRLTELTDDKGKWTRQYWEQLKIDLMKNFSEKRFEHMVKVAKTVYADKIERLCSERKENQQIVEKKVEKPKSITLQNSMNISEAEFQKKKLAEKRRELEVENMRIEAEQRAQGARIKAAQREEIDRKNDRNGSERSKKSMGIVLVIAIIVVVVLIIMALH